MSRHPDFAPQGVISAVLLPFLEDLSIDEPSFRVHLRDVGAVQGLPAITINAHSTEVASCTEDEQRRVMEITGEEVGDSCRSFTVSGQTAAWRRRGSLDMLRSAGLRRC